MLEILRLLTLYFHSNCMYIKSQISTEYCICPFLLFQSSQKSCNNRFYRPGCMFLVLCFLIVCSLYGIMLLWFSHRTKFSIQAGKFERKLHRIKGGELWIKETTALAVHKEIMPPTKDLYAILGIAPSASEDAVKRAYRRLSLQWHPDKHVTGASQHEATSKFQVSLQLIPKVPNI